MRRPLALLALLLALVCLPTAAFAEEAADTALLAAEEGEEGEEGEEEILGPDPAQRTADDNPARELGGYEDQETPFTWGAAWILTFAGVVGLVLMVGLYQLLVRGPAQRASSSR